MSAFKAQYAVKAEFFFPPSNNVIINIHHKKEGKDCEDHNAKGKNTCSGAAGRKVPKPVREQKTAYEQINAADYCRSYNIGKKCFSIPLNII